jgi:hypothetical protein
LIGFADDITKEQLKNFGLIDSKNFLTINKKYDNFLSPFKEFLEINNSILTNFDLRSIDFSFPYLLSKVFFVIPH